MPSPLETTFSLLSSKKSTDASDLLTAALDVPVGAIQSLAVRSLLRKHQLPAQLLVIRKWPQLEPKSQEIVFEEKHTIRETVRHCLERDEGELRKLALEIAVSISDFTQIPLILDLMENCKGKQLSQLTHAHRMLTDQFYDALMKQEQETDGLTLSTESITYQLKTVIQKIAAAVHKLENFEEPELILESLLILGQPTHADVKELLSNPGKDLMKMLEQILLNSKHQGVMQFILDGMNCRNPNYRIIDAIRIRKDPEFINYLLAEFPDKLNAIQSDNFQQIQSIRWLISPEEELPLILPAHHFALIRLLMGVRLPVDQQVEIQKWLIHNSAPDVRLAATEVLTTLDQRLRRKSGQRKSGVRGSAGSGLGDQPIALSGRFIQFRKAGQSDRQRHA
ncbi:MAG: hypothetical protein R3C11_06025 [Planctomycetaceae bacterium]